MDFVTNTSNTNSLRPVTDIGLQETVKMKLSLSNYFKLLHVIGWAQGRHLWGEVYGPPRIFDTNFFL